MTFRTITTDAAAISLSSLCLLHCLVLPVTISMLPASMLWAEAEWVHKALVMLAIPVTLLAILRPGRLQRQGRTLFRIGAVSGLALLFAAAFSEPLHDYEVVLTVIGATILACIHTWRWAYHRHMNRR